MSPHTNLPIPANAPVSAQTPVPQAPYVNVAAYAAPTPASQARRYVTFLGKKWWILLLSLLCFGGLAAAYIAYWPVSFKSVAHMWAAGKVGLQLREGTTYAEDTQTFAGTQAELLQSEKILLRALARVQNVLHISIPTNAEGKVEFVTLRVSQLPKSAVLELKAKGPTEQYTRAFLDATMDEFLAYKKEVRSATSGDTYTSVSEQITRQEAELKAAQEKLMTYQRDNNVAVLEEQAKAASIYLTQLLAEYSQLKLEYQLLEATTAEGQWAVAAVTNVLAGAPDPRQLADRRLSSASPPPEFLAAQAELQKIRIMRARLSSYMRPKHPKIVKLDEEISRGEKLVEYFASQSREQLDTSKKTARLKMTQVQEAIKEWETKVNNASERIAEYQRQKLDVERLQGFHDRLLSLLQTVDVTRNLDQENITILDRASETKPGKLHPAIVIALALFLGLGTGLALVYLVERVDDRVLSQEELGERFSEWIVGQVPEVPAARKKAGPALVELNDRRHVFAESYRNIRSALFFAPRPEEKPKTLLVTSAIPNEGKSTVAANLARTMAFAGSRVLLIDGDLRCGVLHKLFDQAQEPGLSDVLSDDSADFNRFVKAVTLSSPQVSESQAASCGGLFLLARGKPVPNSGELFLRPKFGRLLAQCREQFDYVIVDSIPVFAADDTTSLAPKVDGVLFVVRGGFSSTQTIRQALELLYERQARIFGLVFNRANSHSASYKYYRYSEYSQSKSA